MKQQNKEIKLRLELECTYFEVAEIQADYDDFVGRLLPETIRGVLFLLAFLREYYEQEKIDCDLVELLFHPKRIRRELFPPGPESMEQELTDEADRQRSRDRKERRSRPDDVENLPLYVDPYDFQLVEALVTATFQEEEVHRDFKDLFSVFLLQASSGLQLRDKLDQRIPFFFIQQQICLLRAPRAGTKTEIQEYSGSGPRYSKFIFDYIQRADDADLGPWLQQKMVADAEKMLLRRVADQAHVEQKQAVLEYMLDPKERTSNRDVYRRLRDKFGIDKLQILDEQMIALVLRQRFSREGEDPRPGRSLLRSPDFGEFEIDVDALNGAFTRRLKALARRDDVVRDLAASILEKGYTYRLLFESILGIRNIETATISEEQLEQCFQLLDFELEPKRFRAFFASFTDGSDDLVAVADILKEAERLRAGVEAQATKGQGNTKVKKAQRRFYPVTQVKRFIGEKIVEHKMKFFGQLLKGQDFDYDKD